MNQALIPLLAPVLLCLSCSSSGGSPSSAEKVQWEGSWQSGASSSVHGSLQAEFPFALGDQLELTVPVTFTYAETSPYRPGVSTQVDFELTLGQAQGTVGVGQVDFYTFALKGAPTAGQTITFSTLMDLGADQVSGEYESRGPMDVGSFELQKQ